MDVILLRAEHELDLLWHIVGEVLKRKEIKNAITVQTDCSFGDVTTTYCRHFCSYLAWIIVNVDLVHAE